MTTTRTGKPSARIVLADEPTRLREDSGWSLADLAEKTTYDRTYLLRLEKGEKLGSAEAMAALDRAYGTGRLLEQLWLLARDDVDPDRYRRFMALEAEATVMQQFSVSTLPGLLQTERYARALLRTARPRTEEQLAEQVAARVSRQALLRGENPPHLRALLDESVLRRAPRDSALWREQLQRLLTDAELPHITLQVIPFTSGLHDLLDGSLTLLWLPKGRSVAYLEGSRTGDLVEETAQVEQLKLSYDLLRDSALQPEESLAFIRNVMEDGTPCPRASTT
jgi:transcriptional regulator with XRE-family HTH domain